MARKHNLKRHRIKQPVERTLMNAVLDNPNDRKIVLNPETDKYEIVKPVPIFRQGRAMGPTKRNAPKKKGR